jgi:hypothetical protein
MLHFCPLFLTSALLNFAGFMTADERRRSLLSLARGGWQLKHGLLQVLHGKYADLVEAAHQDGLARQPVDLVKANAVHGVDVDDLEPRPVEKRDNEQGDECNSDDDFLIHGFPFLFMQSWSFNLSPWPKVANIHHRQQMGQQIYVCSSAGDDLE